MSKTSQKAAHGYSNGLKLVVGATGYLGQALIPRLKGKIRVLDRNEEKLAMLKEKYKDIEIVVGDISNEWIVKKAMQGIDEVY